MLVRDENELMDAVLDALDDLQTTIRGEGDRVRRLWNEYHDGPAVRCKPKPEVPVSREIALELGDPAKLDKLIDVDSFLAALALDNATVNLDSYVGMAQNYYLYRRPSDQKWVWIVWDPSLAFGALSQGLTVQQMKDLALEWVQSTSTGALGGGGIGGASVTRPIATRLWQVPAYKQRYREIYRSIVEKQMVTATVTARMNALRDLIRPFVEKDTQKLVTQAQFDAAMTSDATSGLDGGPGGPGGAGGIQSGAPGLQPFIEGRVTSIKALLNGQNPLLISAAPASLFFAQTSGGTSASSQNLALALSDTTKSGTFTATASSPWVTVSPAAGTLPATLQISTSAANLATGTYSGSVAIAVAGTSNTPLSIPVVLRVVSAPAILSNPASLTLTSFGAGAPGAPGGPVTAQTQTLALASTAGASPFAANISDTTCSNFLSVSPLSGTTPAILTVTANPPSGTGDCSGRINITSSGLASATVPVTMTSPTLPGGFQVAAITAVANSASYTVGLVAPGSIVTIFGNNIGPRDLVGGTFNNGQLATSLGGVQVTFDGTPAPVLYARSNQVGVVVPFEVAGKTQTSLQLSLNGQPTAPVQQSVGPTSPGIYTTASTGNGQASVINQTGTVNGANAPAAKASIVAIYITGAGQLIPAGKTGALGTATQAIAASVAVTIGGQDAAVTYAGAAPGSLQGLYQINAMVPAGSASGSVPVQVKVGGTSAQSAVTMYVQ
jgi:uncharacterized protein (TIGR03437 family)